jgi:hypothetical protein
MPTTTSRWARKLRGQRSTPPYSSTIVSRWTQTCRRSTCSMTAALIRNVEQSIEEINRAFIDNGRIGWPRRSRQYHRIRASPSPPYGWRYGRGNGHRPWSKLATMTTERRVSLDGDGRWTSSEGREAPVTRLTLPSLSTAVSAFTAISFTKSVDDSLDREPKLYHEKSTDPRAWSMADADGRRLEVLSIMPHRDGEDP